MHTRLPILILMLATLFLFPTDIAFSHMIPFAFVRASVPVLNWDFTAMTSLPSQLTFTRASTATYFNSSGVMQTAATNAPRFDYDMTTHAAQGLLLEPAATNMIACSDKIDLATCWSNGASPITVSQNTIVAPDGTTSADRATATADAYIFPTSPTTTIGVTYTFSIYAKTSNPGTGTLVLQEDGGAYTWYGQVNMDLTTSWQRFTVTAAKTTSNPMRAVIGLYYSTGGDTNIIDLWGAQYEIGTEASSYIPTTSAAATRAAETVTFNTLSWYNASSGVINAEYTNLGAENATIYRVFGLFNTNVAGTFANNSIEISDQGTTATSYVSSGGAVQAAGSGTLYAVNVANTQTVSYQANNFLYSLNHGAVGADTAGSLPTALYGYIGSQPDGNMRKRYIRKIKYSNANQPAAVVQGM